MSTLDEPLANEFKKGVVAPKQDDLGKGLKIAIVAARWNAGVVQSLKSACIATLLAHSVHQSDILVIDNIPGAFELPFTCKSLIVRGHSLFESFQPDAVIALGCLIKGDTPHFEYIANACTLGLSQVGLETGVPVVMGVLTCLTEEQAKMRSGLSAGHNHGEDYAFAAMEMARLKFWNVERGHQKLK